MRSVAVGGGGVLQFQQLLAGQVTSQVEDPLDVVGVSTPSTTPFSGGSLLAR
jgi:hypothetical protein